MRIVATSDCHGQLHKIEKSHWWFSGRRQILLSIIDRLRIRAESSLDVGCGAGTNLDLLAQRYPGGSFYGIDVELDPLLFCRADRAVPVCQASVAELPFKSSVFDLVTALDTLEHLEDDEATLRELFRVCRPAGTLLLTVPAFSWLWGNVDRLGDHYRRYTRKELLRKVAGAGFSVQFVGFFNFLLFPPIAAIRLLARLLPGQHSADAQTIRSDFDLVKGGPLNTLLARIFSLETSLLHLKPPFGVSLVCVAVRNSREDRVVTPAPAYAV